MDSRKKFAVAIGSTCANRRDGGGGNPKPGHRADVGSFQTDSPALEGTISCPSFGRIEERRPAARPYPKSPPEKSAGSRAGHSAHDTPRRHSLEHPHHGQGAGHQPDGGSAYLGSPRAEASSDQDFQAQPRPTFCRKALRCGRPLSQPSRQGPGLVRRREKPNPGTRSYPARTADQEGALRDNDARLQAQRHDHTVRRAEHARWQSDRRLHAASSTPGIHSFPQQDRRRDAVQSRSASYRGQYATHKHPRVKYWMRRHPRFHIHFIPTSSSWLNLVERWFREITDKRIRRGSFHNVPELIAAIEDYLKCHNQNPRVFVWKASADSIMTKIAKCKEALGTLH